MTSALDYFKYGYSSALLIFSVVCVMACIVTGQSKAATYGIHPILAVISFWILLIILGFCEGGQACLVGLKSMDVGSFRESHRTTYRSCSVAHRGRNLEKFIVGRQFLVVLLIFTINMMGEAIPGAHVLNLPDVLNAIFLGNSLAMILTVIDIGQLPWQVVTGATAFLDFIQNKIFLCVLYVSLGIEFSGLLHSVYFFQQLFEGAAKILENRQKKKRKSSESGDEESPDDNDGDEVVVEDVKPLKSIGNRVFFWVRVLFSMTILAFAFAVTFSALINGNSGMWEGVPIWASVLIFVVLLVVVGLMEGMQIAAFALLNMDEEELRKHKIAHKNCTLMFEGENLQSFLIGRQILVALLMFIVARVVSIQIPDGQGNVFGVPDWLQSFIDTGLLGALILTVVGSLVWRVVASSLPLMFMSNPVLYVIIRACFILEAIGVCSVSWLLSYAINKILGLKMDEEYFTDIDKKRKRSAGTMETAAIDFDPDSSQTFSSRPNAVRDDDDSDEDDDLPNERDDHAKLPVAQKSMREILFPEGDDLNKMKSALVKSARMSAVVSCRDIDLLMADLDDDNDKEESEDNDNNRTADIESNSYDSDDDDDLQGSSGNNRRASKSVASKSLRDISKYLSNNPCEDDDDEDDNEVNSNEKKDKRKSLERWTSARQQYGSAGTKSMRDMFGLMLGSTRHMVAQSRRNFGIDVKNDNNDDSEEESDNEDKKRVDDDNSL